MARQQAEGEARAAQRRKTDKALRRKPARAWRVGRTLFWDPPATADELRPLGYRVSEQRSDGQ